MAKECESDACRVKISPLRTPDSRLVSVSDFKDYSAAMDFVGVYDANEKRIFGGVVTSIDLTTADSEIFEEVDLSKILKHNYPYKVAVVDRDTEGYPEDLNNTAIVAVWDMLYPRRVYSIDIDRCFK